MAASDNPIDRDYFGVPFSLTRRACDRVEASIEVWGSQLGEPFYVCERVWKKPELGREIEKKSNLGDTKSYG